MGKVKKQIERIFDTGWTFRSGQLCLEDDNGRVQEMIATSDTKQFFRDAINMYFMNDDPLDDNQWKSIFREIPSTSHGELFPFRPPDAAGAGSHGIVFESVGEGGEIRFSKVVSAEKYVKNQKYATAIGYSNEWFSDGQMGMIEMVTQDFRQAAADKMSSIHYSAIIAAATSGISSSTSFGTYTATGSAFGVSKLINDLNGITSVMRRARRRPEIILAPPELEQIVLLALNRSVESGNQRAIQNEYTARLKPVISEFMPYTSGSATGTLYVIEPKRRLVSTNRLPLSLGNFQDLLHDSETLVGKFRRGVLVGEGAVIHRLTAVPREVVGTTDI